MRFFAHALQSISAFTCKVMSVDVIKRHSIYLSVAAAAAIYVSVAAAAAIYVSVAAAAAGWLARRQQGGESSSQIDKVFCFIDEFLADAGISQHSLHCGALVQFRIK